MEIGIFDFSIKLSKYKTDWAVSVDPHEDGECDTIFKSPHYVDANRFFAMSIINLGNNKNFKLFYKNSLQNGDQVAIFRSERHFKWTSEGEEK